ncbi:hypothetical protein H1R20_g6450, partial [Candolleomyces eurysporus]
MLQRSPDPTLVLLIFLWHAFCGWAAALESLNEYITKLENDLPTPRKTDPEELPRIRAHHLHYSSLLDDFIGAVDFVQETPTPFMTSSNFDQALLDESASLMTRECKNLRHEIVRLKAMLHQQEQRLQNRTTAIKEGYMTEMTQAAIRDGAAMKQIAYLTMVFLPPSFVAGVFGMNVFEISPESRATMPQYIAAAVPLTVLTMAIAFLSKTAYPGQEEFWSRLIRPLKELCVRYIQKSKTPHADHSLERVTAERISVLVAPTHASRR